LGALGIIGIMEDNPLGEKEKKSDETVKILFSKLGQEAEMRARTAKDVHDLNFLSPHNAVTGELI